MNIKIFKKKKKKLTSIPRNLAPRSCVADQGTERTPRDAWSEQLINIHDWLRVVSALDIKKAWWVELNGDDDGGGDNKVAVK